jgi:hypothetical protein
VAGTRMKKSGIDGLSCGDLMEGGWWSRAPTPCPLSLST